MREQHRECDSEGVGSNTGREGDSECEGATQGGTGDSESVREQHRKGDSEQQHRGECQWRKRESKKEGVRYGRNSHACIHVYV